MMQEEYSPPNSNLVETKRLSLFQACILILLICVAIGCYYVAHVIPINFVEVFASFNTELPLVTNLVVKTYPSFIFLSYFSVALVLGLASFIVNYENQQLIYKLAKINAFLSFLLMVVVIVAMYLPVFMAN